MDIDLDLYRHEVRVSTNPLVHTAALRRAPLVRRAEVDISRIIPWRGESLSTEEEGFG